MECQIITKENEVMVARMERFAKSHEKSHFLQLPQWAQVKEYWEWRGVIAWENEKILGTMSVLIRRLPAGYSLLYAPRGPVCNRNDPYVLSCLLGGADELAAEQNALELWMDPDEAWDNRSFREGMAAWGFREYDDNGFNHVQAQHVFRLHLRGKTEESVFRDFCQKTRYNVRLAMRRGVAVRAYPGNGQVPEAELEAFDRIMQETGQRDRFIPRGKAYYRQVLDALRQDAVLFMAYLAGEPIAGTIGVFSGGKGWYLYGASSDEHRNSMPNYLLQWEMICEALKRKCVFYDFRGVPGEPRQDAPLYGLYRFKKGFGGTYTKFTGLLIRRYRPLPARCFEIALQCFRRMRGIKCCK